MRIIPLHQVVEGGHPADAAAGAGAQRGGQGDLRVGPMTTETEAAAEELAACAVLANSAACHRLEEMMERAAAKAVKSTFRDIGLYAETPAEQAERRKDLDHLNKWRRAVERAAVIVGTAVLTALAGGMLAVFWLGIRLHLLKQP